MSDPQSKIHTVKSAIRNPQSAIAGSPFVAESLGRSLSVYIPAMAVSKVAGFVRGIALAWWMIKSEFGLFQVSLFVINLLVPLCGLSIAEGLTRYASAYRQRGQLAAFFRRGLGLAVIIGAAGSSMIAIAAGALAPWLFGTFAEGAWNQKLNATPPQEMASLVRWTAGCTFALIGYHSLLGMLRGLQMFRAISLMEVSSSLLFLAAALPLAAMGFGSTRIILGAYIVSTVAPSIPLLIGLKRWTAAYPVAAADPSSPTPAGSLGRQLLRYGAWSAVAAGAWHALQYYPLWHLYKVAGGSEAAVFAAARNLAQMVQLAIVTIAAVVQSNVIGLWESDSRESAAVRLHAAAKLTLLATLVGSLLIAALAGPAMRVYPAEYSHGAAALVLLLLSFHLHGGALFLSMAFGLLERAKLLALPWVVGLAVNVGLGFGLLGWRGWIGWTPSLAKVDAAGWAAAVGMAANLATCVVAMRLLRWPLDRGLPLILAAGVLLLMGSWGCLAGAVLLVAVSVKTSVLLTPADRLLLTGLWRGVRNRPPA